MLYFKINWGYDLCISQEADSKCVKTSVVTPSSLTDAEKAKVADKVKKVNPTTTDIKVNNDGPVVVTFEDVSGTYWKTDRWDSTLHRKGVPLRKIGYFKLFPV